MGDVSAIKSLSTGDEELRSKKLLWSKHASRNIDDQGRMSQFDPRRINCNHRVAHAGDQVHKELISMSFGQPDRIANLTFESMLTQMPERLRHVFGAQKDVEIFRVAADSGVLLQRKRASHSVGHVPVFKDA